MRAQNNSSRDSSYGPHGDGAEIMYAIVDSALGRLMVAGTRRGICFAAMGEADRALVAELRGDYPLATIRVADPNRRADARIGQWADALAEYIAGRSKMPTPPMDIRGTPFQFAVWDQLRAIPAGQTRSYSEIARRIGRPRAIRAVGTANGANPVSIIIPCHRALRASGHLGGYRWGLERKRKLLEMERSGQPLRLS
ncbi:MAG TPA: methylated-DNA--[protein]-cysteine S-methyltransferase [Candidatus Binatus sp.]|uniref:methylated-DNA--[protein]-cysteine S-methyltransferase n=1 Tax=Candidatus Binatus sp. TaxID=2811406 RepID=UPI002F419360